MNNEHDIGVIVGRFQVHELHKGHQSLIEQVLDNHKKTIIFLGVPRTIGTPRNPLDFVSRKLMIEELYPQVSAILPITDQNSDTLWSKHIDEKITEVFPKGSVLLYGSRDSFVPHYCGKFDTHELEPTSYFSGTEIRKHIANDIKSSHLFRAGVIYGLYNTHPTVYSTVDVAIKMPSGKYLMAKKPNEEKYRFVGGFVDVDDASDIVACRREVGEEVGINVDGYQFISSIQVDDWRYRSEPDRSIMTRFYHGSYIHGRVNPDDDISEAKEMDLDEMNESTIVAEHLPLVDELKLFVKRNK